ncbi:hypothetical protein DZF91_02320 [Actinomadura logoneensis]|uniref:Uncharacterized protein n=1 Tax=Actinomadura logoneensis TaxID=2293572 RepID=A0A372JT82_9ACTN|nr:hypothetical protein DZF91_02320 [Actinomadura logoneensis]
MLLPEKVNELIEKVGGGGTGPSCAVPVPVEVSQTIAAPVEMSVKTTLPELVSVIAWDVARRGPVAWAGAVVRARTEVAAAAARVALRTDCFMTNSLRPGGHGEQVLAAMC